MCRLYPVVRLGTARRAITEMIKEPEDDALTGGRAHTAADRKKVLTGR